jgi:mannose-1-phosphate guanylyltransferase
VILVGGQGTRLRPLTSAVPKPVVRLVDRPFIAFMLEWLRRHGIDDVIMSCGFLADGVRSVLGDGSQLGVKLRFVEEPEPRGTAGALKLAEPMLDERFLMLNGDVLTDIDLTAQIAQHERSGARATLALVPVADPSAYGLVILRERNVSIEREVWPRLVDNGLYGFPSESYWLDIGTPARYLQGTFDIIEGNVKTAVCDRLGDGWAAIAPDVELHGRVIPPAVIERGVKIAAGAHVGSLVVLAENVTVGAGSSVERAVVLQGTSIGAGCELRDCILAPGCSVGDGTHISGGAVLGEGVSVGARNVITRGARIFPGVQLPDGAIEF